MSSAWRLSLYLLRAQALQLRHFKVTGLLSFCLIRLREPRPWGFFTASLKFGLSPSSFLFNTATNCPLTFQLEASCRSCRQNKNRLSSSFLEEQNVTSCWECFGINRRSQSLVAAENSKFVAKLSAMTSLSSSSSCCDANQPLGMKYGFAFLQHPKKVSASTCCRASMMVGVHQLQKIQNFRSFLTQFKFHWMIIKAKVQRANLFSIFYLQY